MNSQQSASFLETIAQAPEAPDASAPAVVRRSKPSAGWRLARSGFSVTLLFDGLVFAAMGVLGWKLVTPWREALSAGESLMAIGLLVCAGLWASICAEDLYRWRKLCRRWSARSAGTGPASLAPSAPADAVSSGAPGPRVRSVALPSSRAARKVRHSPWHVVSRR